MKTPLVHIFTGEGHTFTFGNVEVLHNNESVLVFTYEAARDGNFKEVTFLKNRIVGYSFQI